MSTQELPIADTRSKADRAPLTAAPLAAFLAAARGVKRYAAEHIRQRALRQAETELMALDDRMLRDIGLSRSEITSAVRHARQDHPNGAQDKRCASLGGRCRWTTQIWASQA